MTDLSTISRKQQRDATMLQHPIFLYQRHALGSHGEQCKGEDDEQDDKQREIFDALDNYSMAGILWITDRVFATFEEAKAYGLSNRHNDGELGVGWRVYAVAATWGR